MKNLSAILEDIFKQSSEMQRLADTKNVGLIAFNGAIIIGMTKLTIDFWATNRILSFVFMYVLLMCLISLFLNLASLVAQLRHYQKDTMTFSAENPLFFGKISQMKPHEFINLLKERYKLTEPTNEYESDLATQAIIMSQIAIRKFKLFNTAFFWTICGITTPIGALIFSLFFDPNKNR